jgi:phosphatidylserine/phosphatidylglycerophosphate/cardiolipin synthase-like enzyme
MGMTTGLLAMFLTILNTGWAANIQTMQVAAPTGVTAVPPTLAAPFINSQLNALSPQTSLSGVLQGPGASPLVRTQSLPGAFLPAAIPTLPAPAAAALDIEADAAAPAQAPIISPAAAAVAPAATAHNSGHTVWQRLVRDLPGQKPAASDLQGQKDLADRSFAFKLGGQSAESAGLAVAQDVGVESADGPAAKRIGLAKRPAPGKAKKGDETAPQGDDGGGPNYPHRDIKFNGKTFPSVVFRPNVPMEEKLVEAINATPSGTTLRIALYEFKLDATLDALRAARRRGVDIKIILDYENVFPSVKPDADYQPRRSPEIWALLREGFDISVLRGLGEFGINHNKFAVFSGKMLEYGSYNWSYTAEHNHYENAKFSDDQGDIADYSSYWDYLHGLSKPATSDSKAQDYQWPATVPLPPASQRTVRFNGVDLPAVLFSPSNKMEDALVSAIEAAQKSIDISVFALRSTRIAQALAAKHRATPSFPIRVIIDESQSDSEAFGAYTKFLAAQGIAVRTLSGPNGAASKYPMAEKAHNKLAIFDGKLVEMGSANWTNYASGANFENANFRIDPVDAAAYKLEFEHMWGVAKAYPKPDSVPTLPTDADLQEEIRRQPPTPAPLPGPAHDGSEMPKAGEVRLNGAVLPSFAFRPFVSVEDQLVTAIDATKTSIQVAMYEFTLDKVLEALRRAKKRGVDIKVVLDESHLYTRGLDHRRQVKKPSAQIQALVQEGFDVLTLKGEAGGIQHNKFAVFDNKVVEFGSYNWAETAEQDHYENIKFSDEAQRIAYYRQYFQYMRDLAKPVDQEKLEEVLTRTEAAVGDEEYTSDSSSIEGPETESERVKDSDETGAERASKFPPTPTDPDRPIRLNGQSFPRQLFSPDGGIEAALVQAVKAAKVSIDIAMFSFFSKAVAQAVVDAFAANPDLKIRVVMDFSQSHNKYSNIGALFQEHGIDVKLNGGPNRHGDPMFEKMHNKFMVVDGKMLETGSFNYSPTAEHKSFENANFLDDPLDITAYVWFFEQMYKNSWAPPAAKKAAAPAVAAAPVHSMAHSG